MKTKYLLYLFTMTLSSYILLPNLKADGSGTVKELVIFQTSDIHSHINRTASSWVDMAEMIETERSKMSKKTASMLIDCGDTIPGSLIGVISKGQAAVSILNTLKYDAWILGNHDLEFGFQVLNNLSKDCSADIISGNLQPEEKNSFKSWKLYKKNGIKIIVIGLTSPHIEEWLWGNKLKRYRIMPTFKTLDNIMPAILKEAPDIIILAIHHGRFSPKRLNGFNIHKIADTYPQIDLILGGHSHQEVPGEKCGRSTWYVETGAHAEKFAKIKILIDTKKSAVINIRSKLIPVKKQKTINLKFLNCIKPWRNLAAKFTKNIVGYTGESINSRLNDSMFSGISKLFCQAIAEKSRVNIVFHGAVVKSANFTGDITEKDIFDVIPYEDTICTLELTSEELKIIIHEQLEKKGEKHFQSVLGLIVSQENPNHITIKLANGSALPPDKRYKCAFSSYVLAGAGGRFPKLKAIASQKSSKGVDTDITIRDALREYVKKHLSPNRF